MSGHRKKKKAHEEENSERWLLTYADMITLLVAFFMMMYSMSVMNLEKFKKAAIGIRSGFNGVTLQDKSGGESIIEKGSKTMISPDSPSLLVKPLDLKAEIQADRTRQAAAARQRQAAAANAKLVEAHNQRIHELTKKFNDKMDAATQHGRLAKIVATNKGVAIEMVGDLIFFPKGTAQLSEEAKKILRAMVDVLTGVSNEISVEGHTSAGKLAGTTFLDNWELSTSRATAVVKYLLSTGTIDPKRLSVTGYGEYRPLIQPQPGAAGLEHNDRVRVFIFQD
ncbi:MAG: flagellar motor protein MotB [Candidatus Firestonebacteria bacterium]|nr:flagellar motor protein MotB [Candidatus Firestonebacteria bacterium]